ncbi:MAG TPA: MFS transporter [Pyrinomonadaceae bacterium]|jgi:FSR family fosmidomycin resistance protein-like MFS transporter
MSHQELSDYDGRPRRRAGRRLRALALTLLAVEFLDELVDGSRQTAWPLIRADLQLTYTQVGLLLAVPRLWGNLVEPTVNLLGDTRWRRALILGGGLGFALAALLVGLSRGFASLLLAFVVFNPSGGAFVNLSQAALMDADTARREQNMARWAFAGSLGTVAGAGAINAALALGVGWRTWYVVLAGLSLLLVLVVRRALRSAPAAHEESEHISLAANARLALGALRRGAVWRWLVLLELADLMLDGLHAFLALYFVDVVGVTAARAAGAVAGWAGVGLSGDLLIIPLLERVRGLSYLRWSALTMLCLYPAFLLASPLSLKLALLALVGVCNAGWYSILKAQLYEALPGRSGAALALHNVTDFVGALIPLGLGALAERTGLGTVMWLLVAGPLALLCAGRPRAAKRRAPC